MSVDHSATFRSQTLTHSSAWQTAGRARNSNATSRTPQMRSGTQSPAQQTAPTQPPRQDGPRGQHSTPQPSNVWTQRSSIPNTSNGSAKVDASLSTEESYQPVNGFNTTEVKAFLGRDIGVTASYKFPEAADASARSGSAWGPKREYCR